jgi:ADP-ribose pyrophosphatase YjhB (NUDIX family)
MILPLQVGVKALLKNKQGKYLLLKRSKIKYPEVIEVWDIVGGRINPGTSLEENLKREILEETGLVFKKKPKLVAAQDIIRKNEKHVVRLTYIGEIEGVPKIDGEENEGYEWFTMGEMKKLKGLDRYLKVVIDEL